MTGVQRSFLLVGLGLGLMVAALMLYLQTALNQAVQVPGATGGSGTTQSVPKAPVTNPPAPVASQPAPGANQAAPTAPVTSVVGETTALVTAPASSQPAPEPLTFVVRDGQDFLTVARELQAAKLIGNTDAFLAKVRANDWSGRLQVRTYHFKPGTSEDAILQELITVK